jgi:hypothetical protein
VRKHEISKEKYSITKIATKIREECNLQVLTPNPHKSPSENAMLLKEKVKESIKEIKKRKMGRQTITWSISIKLL